MQKQTNSGPFPSKSQIITKVKYVQIIWEYWEGTLILITDSDPILSNSTVNKSKYLKGWNWSNTDFWVQYQTIFGPFSPQKSHIGQKLTKLDHLGTMTMDLNRSLKNKIYPKQSFSGLWQNFQQLQGFKKFWKICNHSYPHSVPTILRPIGWLIRVCLKIQCGYSTMLG